MSLLDADVISRKTVDYTESDKATGQKLLSDDIQPNGRRAGGCQVDVRWMSGGCQVVLRVISNIYRTNIKLISKL